MGTDRNIRKSGMARVTALLIAPPVGSGLNAYKVYGEEELRQAQAKSNPWIPERPCVFLIDSFIRPAEPALPLVVLETSVVREPFELGNSHGRRTTMFMHVVGRTRGERDDLASFLADNLGASMPIYDYSTSTPVLIEQGTLDPSISIDNVPIRDSLREESSLDAWAMLTLTVLTKN